MERETLPGDLIERVMDVVAGQVDARREELSPQTDLVRDLHIDSLDAVELVLALEERFDITIPDEGPRNFFLRDRATIEMVAECVELSWGTGQAARPEWRRQAGDPPPAKEEPFAQLSGVSESEPPEASPLYSQIDPTQEGYPQFRRATDGMRCVLIPSATVWIGATDPKGMADQRPPHKVHVGSFLMDAEPVSNTAYARFLNSIGPIDAETLRRWCGPDAGDDRGAQFGIVRLSDRWEPIPSAARQPMILVSWLGANAYALWAHRQHWSRYESDSPSFLPTEAQWEYGARGPDAERGPDNRHGPADGKRAPLFGLHRIGRHYHAKDLPAASVSARLGMSPFGLHHMGGNVWQWCRDWYAFDYYSRPEAHRADACNLTATGIRSERGGSWVGPEELTRPAYRRGRPPEAKGRCLGFRCAAPAGLVQCS
jgi:formylglycine-generating enzyme